MRQDTGDLAVTNTDWVETDESPAQPTLTVEYTEPPARLTERIETPSAARLDGEEIDVTFRFQSPVSDPGTRGVLAVSNNVTGAYILEVETPASPVQDFIQAVRRYADATGRATAYMVRLRPDEGSIVTVEKQVFLVYGPDGILLRHHSLIPSGIEI